MTRPPLDASAWLSGEATRTPGMEALWARIRAESAGLPDPLRLPPAEGRALTATLSRAWNVDLPEMDQVDAVAVPAADRTVPCRLYTPRRARGGAILFIHGGGWSVCDLDTHERFARFLAETARMRVLSVDYRLAPEHPYPAGLDDCVAAWRWLARQFERDAALSGPSAAAGDSAGANLALALMLHEAERGRSVPDAGMLFYGAYAADFETPSYRRFAEGYGLTRARMMQLWEWYAPGVASSEAGRDPLIQPLMASEGALARLPPLYLNAAGLDPLLSDTLALARRLDEAGSSYRLDVHPGLHHSFMQWTAALEEARAAFAPIGRFVDETLWRDGGRHAAAE